eukprot:scaffold673760_cov39-Prasinocladus_malaysianus.AAC.2
MPLSRCALNLTTLWQCCFPKAEAEEPPGPQQPEFRMSWFPKGEAATWTNLCRIQQHRSPRGELERSQRPLFVCFAALQAKPCGRHAAHQPSPGFLCVWLTLPAAALERERTQERSDV